AARRGRSPGPKPRTSDGDEKAALITAGQVVQQTGKPGTGGGAAQGREHDAAEDYAEVLAFEDLDGNGTEHRDEAVAEHALCRHRDAEQERVGRGGEPDRRHVAGGEAGEA